MKQPINTRNPSIEENLAHLCKGLFYISETDAEVLYFTVKSLDCTDPKALGKYFDIRSTAKFEIGNVKDFFSQVTTVKDWFTKDRREAAIKFKKIEALFADELTETRMIRFGRIRIEIFLIGIDSEGNTVGIRTKAVET